MFWVILKGSFSYGAPSFLWPLGILLVGYIPREFMSYGKIELGLLIIFSLPYLVIYFRSKEDSNEIFTWTVGTSLWGLILLEFFEQTIYLKHALIPGTLAIWAICLIVTLGAIIVWLSRSKVYKTHPKFG